MYHLVAGDLCKKREKHESNQDWKVGRTSGIQGKLIERAKERISTHELSMSEIAYEPGFEHLQSFSRLLKAKTQLSPMEFRESFKN